MAVVLITWLWVIDSCTLPCINCACSFSEPFCVPIQWNAKLAEVWFGSNTMKNCMARSWWKLTDPVSISRQLGWSVCRRVYLSLLFLMYKWTSNGKRTNCKISKHFWAIKGDGWITGWNDSHSKVSGTARLHSCSVQLGETVSDPSREWFEACTLKSSLVCTLW